MAKREIQRPPYFKFNRAHFLERDCVARYMGWCAGSATYHDGGTGPGNRNDSTLAGFANPGAAWGRKNGRSVLTYNGAAQYVDTGFNLGTTYPYSIGFWGQKSSATNGQAWGQSTNKKALAYYTTGVVHFNGATSNLAWTFAHDLLPHYFLAVVTAANTASVYVDGNLLTSSVSSAALNPIGTTLYVGGRGTTNGWPGWIADFVVWNRDMSPFAQALASPDPMYYGWIQAVGSRVYSFGTTVATGNRRRRLLIGA